MQRGVLVITLLIFTISWLPSQPVVAQSTDGYPPCSNTQLEATTDSLLFFNDSLGTFYELGDAPKSEAFMDVLIQLDDANYEYWHEYYPDLPLCLEAQNINNSLGMILDEALVNALLARYVFMQSDQEAVEYLKDVVIERYDYLYEQLQLLADREPFDNMSEKGRQACTDEEIETTFQVLQAVYIQSSMAFQEGNGPDGLLPVVIEFETVTIDYWRDILPSLPQCAEAQVMAYELGFITEDMFIVLILTDLAKMEAYAGNVEVSGALLASGNQRLIDIEEPLLHLQELYGTVPVEE